MFLIFVLRGMNFNDLAISAVGTKTSKFVNNSRIDSYSSYFDV